MSDPRIQRERERTLILEICEQIALSDKLGDYVYLNDLIQYLEEHDIEAGAL